MDDPDASYFRHRSFECRRAALGARDVPEAQAWSQMASFFERRSLSLDQHPGERLYRQP